jgi:hypothetical protein
MNTDQGWFPAFASGKLTKNQFGRREKVQIGLKVGEKFMVAVHANVFGNHFGAVGVNQQHGVAHGGANVNKPDRPITLAPDLGDQLQQRIIEGRIPPSHERVRVSKIDDDLAIVNGRANNPVSRRTFLMQGPPPPTNPRTVPSHASLDQQLVGKRVPK